MRPHHSPLVASLLLAALLPCVAPHIARADIYAFTDAGGVTHFSNVPTDDRYHLILAAPAPAAAPAPRAARVHGKAVNWLARSAKYDQVIDRAARAATIQPALVRAVIAVESGFNPRAVSKRGAIGLMQLRPSTARHYGVTDIYDPAQNIRAGARFLGDLMARFGSNLELALAAYDAGEGAVERYGGHVPPYRETLNYVPNVIRVYRRLLIEGRSTGV